MDSLKQKNLKQTEVRTGVLGIFQQAKKPIDVPTLIDMLRKLGIKSDQATVYRTLNSFVEKQILKRVELQEGRFRYELASLPHHHHLVCQECGDISGVGGCTVEEISKDIAQNNSFQITDHKMEFFGLCKQCQ